MNARSAKWFAIWATLLSLAVFVGLTYDSIVQIPARTPPVTGEVTAGKRVWQAKSCVDCHTILGNGAYFAPDLTKTAAKRDARWLTSFLTEPKQAFPVATMPNPKLTGEEIGNLIAFLSWVERVDTNGWPPAPRGSAGSARAAGAQDPAAAEGRRLYDDNGCSSCHAKAGLGGSVGPDLTRVGSTRDAAWLTRKLEDPASTGGSSFMPSYKELGEAKLKALVAYLLTLK